MGSIKQFDFGNSIFSRKVPFEIEFICKYDSDCELRYLGFHNVIVERKNYFDLIETIRKKKVYTEVLQQATIDDLEPYYQSYEAGFKKGYGEFVENVKEATALFFDDKYNTVKKIFEYITKPTTLQKFALEWKEKKLVNVLKRDYFFENGVESGEKYRAWLFMVENPNFFDYFIELILEHKPFVGFYRKQYKNWKEMPGGIGVVQHLQKVLERIDEKQVKNENGFGKESPPPKKPQPQVYAIMHIFWAMHDKTKAINKTNNEMYAKEYGCSCNTLLQFYNHYAIKENREKPEGRKEIKTSIRPFVKRFEEAAAKLEAKHPQYCKEIKRHLRNLKEQYAAYLV